ncbi:MAG TPA: hypothetical protein VFS37_15820 [Conexibacter sp.]|nr:hypothetical protein [Conexibacter sp.]
MSPDDPLLEAVENLSHWHREHEKHYAAAPLEDALALQRTSRTLKALAERWSEAAPTGPSTMSPFAGADDLNDERAVEEAGVLFMEGEGEPAELAAIKRELRAHAARAAETGAWLAQAMEQSWAVAERLLAYPHLADLIGERHRIIANDWQNAAGAQLVAQLLDRVAAILDAIDFRPAALREDLAGERLAPKLLFSAAELLDRAADLSAESAVLVHENDRRWRVFHARVASLS